MLDGLLKELVSVPGFYETVLLVILLGIKAENASQLPLMPGGLPLVVSFHSIPGRSMYDSSVSTF